MQTTSPMSHFLLRFSWTFSLFLTHSLIMRDHLSDAMFTGHRSLPRSGYLCVLDVAIVHGQSPVVDVIAISMITCHAGSSNACPLPRG